MKKYTFILIFILLGVFFYVKTAFNKFKIRFAKISKISIKDNKLKGIVTLFVTNELLPTFDITKVNLDLVLNRNLITPITNIDVFKNGKVNLKLDVDLDIILTQNNLTSVFLGENLKIIGIVAIKKGIIRKKIEINEAIKIL